ncbi:TadE/TadG family type IV pilus assembly protein [Janibacter cremeus]|uniref:Flp pilus assembly protein TadG n=1 Tax=Janibacter cremeus TaxID=1285192 RepID=A0A852VUS7_9MICO|nr:Flp pilus assembly protein TadG [Janibacter cremeus]
MIGADRLRGESGSAVVDFVMTSALLMFVFLAVLQLGLALHVRNTLISCAAEGARYGARDGATPEQGAGRARELISGSLSSRFAGGVSASVQTTAADVRVLVVDVTAPIPLVGPIGPSESLEVSGRAFMEDQ